MTLDERCLADLPPTDEDLEQLHADMERKESLDFRAARWVIEDLQRLRRKMKTVVDAQRQGRLNED